MFRIFCVLTKIEMEKKLLISLTGNIGAGKTTLINKLKEHLAPIAKDSEFIRFVEEPTEEWSLIRCSDGKTFFEKIYDNPQEKDAFFNFQLLAIDTRVKKLYDCISKYKDTKILIIERSPYDDYYVFSKMMHKRGLISVDQMKLIEIRLGLWKLITENTNFISFHIDCEPKDCLARIKERIKTGTRPSESSIQLDYLEDIREHYNSMKLEIPRTISVETGEIGSIEYSETLEKIKFIIETFLVS